VAAVVKQKMVILGYTFKPKLWAILVTVAFFLVFVELGKWQLSRADEKNFRQQQLDMLSQEPTVTVPGSPVKLQEYEYRTVEVKGYYKPEHLIYLDNKTYKGVAGYHILMPVQLSNSTMHVVINRGWVAMGYDRSILPEVPTEIDEVTIVGRAASTEIRTFELSDQVVTGLVWENFNIQRYQDETGLEFQPIMVLQHSEAKDGLIRDWHRPDSGAAKNIGYAVQWFALAATTIILFVVLNGGRTTEK